MPPESSPQPKVKRSKLYSPSWPICATNSPSTPISQPLSGSRPTRLPDIVTPNKASQKNSYAPNDSATLASIGVKAARHSTPNSVPMNAPEVAMPIARPASPRSASAWPSAHDAAFAAVPGMFSRMAVRDPPYKVPTYEHTRIRMAVLAGSLIVSVVSSAMHSVADSPGRHPTMMPSKAPPMPYAIEMGFRKPRYA